MEKLRLAVIGAGPIVEKKHLPALTEVGEINVMALCRRNSVELDRIAHQFRVGGRHTDYRRVLDQKDIDAVLIATGPEAQAQIVRDAVAAGKHIFVEKPMALTSTLAREIADEIRSAGVYFQIGFNKRFYYGYQTAKQTIVKGELGESSGVSARFWLKAGRRDSWLHNAIHFFDLLHFLMGPIAEVSARRYMPQADRKTNLSETAVVSISFNGGAVGNLLFSTLASWDYPNEHLDIVGSNGNALSVENGNRVHLYRAGENEAIRLHENTLSVHWWSGNEEQGFVPQLRTFARSILYGLAASKNPDDPIHFVARADDGIRSLVALEAAKRSIAEGINVKVSYEGGEFK